MVVTQSTTTTHLVVPYFDECRAHLEPLPALSPPSTPASPNSRTTIKRRNSQYGTSTSSLSTKRPRIFSEDDDEHVCQSPESMTPDLPPRAVKRSRSNESLSTLSSCSSDDPKTPRMQINDRDFESDIDLLADPLDLSSPPTLLSHSNTSKPKHHRHQRHLSIPPRSDEHATLDDFLGNLVRNADIIKQNAQALRTALSYERSCELRDEHVNGKPCVCLANTGMSVLSQYRRRQRELTLPLLETLVEPREEVVRVPLIRVEVEEA